MGDYRELWRSLEMDLEKHDLLCEALPPLYEGVYLSQENRPQGMNYFNFVVSEVHGLRIQELKEHKEKGGKVLGTFCLYVPDEIINAAGAIGVGLCGGSQFWVPDGEKVLPRNMCPLIKAFVGAKVGRTCPYFQSCDMLVGETTCDGKKKAWEILNEYTPTHVMELPQMKRDADFSLWFQEVKRFKEKLEELTGNKIDGEKLSDSINLINQKRKALKRLYETRKADPVPISGKDALLISQIAFYDDIERFTAKVNELCDELEERVEKGIGVFPKGAPRIMVTGSPMAIPNWKLHHIIEESGAAVVCEETCTGTRYFEKMVEPQGDTERDFLEAIAKRYFNINCACFTPNDQRIDDIIRLAKEYKVDGVIYYNLQFCTTYAVEYGRVEKALKNAGIPLLYIETDYGNEDVGQIKTRIDAFLEMIR